MNINKYIKIKKKVLSEFGIELTSTQERHIDSLKTESDVDAFARDLIGISTMI